jgi:RND family efflux transporter MFP subunit
MAQSDTCPAALREELAGTRVEEDGIVYYDVIDPSSGREFRFYEHEYLLARQLRSGRSLEELAAWVRAELGIESSAADVKVFIEHVAGLGFLGAASAPPPGAVPVSADEALTTRVPDASVAQFAAAAAAVAELADATAVPFAAPAASPAPAPAPVTPAPAPVTPAPAPVTPAPAPRGEAAAPSGARIAAAAAQAAQTVAAQLEAARPARAAAPSSAPASGAAAAAAAVGVAPRPAPPVRRPARSGISVVWLVVPILLLAVALGAYAALVHPRQPAVALAPVKLAAARAGAVLRFRGGPARLEAPEPLLLGFTSAGRLGSVLPAGKRVEAGEVLARLDGAAQVQRELERVREREAHYRLRLEAAQEKGLKGELKMIERKVEEKRRLVEEKRARLAALALASPAPGILVAVTAKPGEAVKAGQPVLKFMPLRLRAELDLPAAEAGSLRAGQTAQLALAAGQVVEGRLEAAEPKGGAVHLRITVEQGQELKAGDAVRLIRARFEQVVTVPRAALAKGPQGDLVYVLAGDVVRARPVTVVDRGETDVLVSRGLAAGERYVVAGAAALADGQRVKVAP